VIFCSYYRQSTNTDQITVGQKSARNFVGVFRTAVFKSTTNEMNSNDCNFHTQLRFNLIWPDLIWKRSSGVRWDFWHHKHVNKVSVRGYLVHCLSTFKLDMQPPKPQKAAFDCGSKCPLATTCQPWDPSNDSVCSWHSTLILSAVSESMVSTHSGFQFWVECGKAVQWLQICFWSGWIGSWNIPLTAAWSAQLLGRIRSHSPILISLTTLPFLLWRSLSQC